MQWFVVKYRKPDGAMTEAEFEAADKSALFKLLAEKKISAVNIQLGRLDNKKRGRKSAVRGISSGLSLKHISGIVVCVAVVLSALFSLRFALSKEAKSSKKVLKNNVHNMPKLTKEIPQVESIGIGKVGRSNKVDSKDGSRFVTITNEGPIKVGDPLWREKGYAHPRKPKVFKSASDQILSMVADIAEGKDVPPIPIDEHFEKEFLESLKTPIEILDDDSERIVKMKNSVNQLRQELSERAEAGESAYTIIREFEKTMAENYKIRSEIQEDVRKILEEGDREGAKEYLSQMNQALWKMGIKEVEMPMTAEEKAAFIQQFRREEAERRSARESKKQ